MENTTYEKANQLKTNKTIIVIITIMVIVCPIPSEGKGGCVAPHHKRSQPRNVYKWFLSILRELC